MRIDWRHVSRWLSTNVNTVVRSGYQASLDLIFPHVCVLCNEPLWEPACNRAPFCADCFAELVPCSERICLRCGSPLARSAMESGACAACRMRQYAFESAAAYGVYRGALRRAVLKAKRAAHEPLATALGQLLAVTCRTRWPQQSLDVVVPMPMHWRRRWRRGTNSAELLAEAVARQLQLPLRKLLMLRKATAKQGTLTPRERFANVRGAFRLIRPRPRLAGQRILLIDDVMTTGATASEAARALRAAGAGGVHVAVVARGVGK